MYRRLSAILFPVVALVLLGTAFWGYQEHQDKNQVLIKAENQYQRAFHDLTYHMDQLNTQLASAIAVATNGADWHRKCLLNVWRLTSEAQNEVNQLPLTMLPFSNTEKFLAQVSQYAYRTAIRNLDQSPLNEEESATLVALFERSKEVTAQLRDIQQQVLVQNLRWMDVEMQLAQLDEPGDNKILTTFLNVDKHMNGYEEMNWGPTMSALFDRKEASANLGPDASPEDARREAARFLGFEAANMQVVENGVGTELNTYTVSFPTSSGRAVSMDLSKKGAKLLLFSHAKEIGQPTLDVNQAAEIGARFLESKGYGSLEPVIYDDYQNVAAITYVAVQDGVLIMPQKVVVKVALDDGEITGLQARDFEYEKKQRTIPEPKVTADDARATLNESFNVTEESLVLMKNDLREEVLAHQFTGQMMGAEYRIYINADNGMQEAMEKIRNIEARIEAEG